MSRLSTKKEEVAFGYQCGISAAWKTTATVRDQGGVWKQGEGQAVRQSKTSGKIYIYYAVRMNVQQCRRVATETGGVLSIVQGMLPIIAVMVVILFVICTFLGRLLTDGLLRPIEQMAETMDYVKEAVYQEMEPFIDTIRRQHGEDI